MTVSHDQIIARIQCFYDKISYRSRIYEELSETLENQILCEEINNLLYIYEDLFTEIVVKAE